MLYTGVFLKQDKWIHWVVALACMETVEEVGHHHGTVSSVDLLSSGTRATCLLARLPAHVAQLRRDLSRSGKNQMFSFTSGAATLSFSRKWQPYMSRYRPQTLLLPEKVVHSELGLEDSPTHLCTQWEWRLWRERRCLSTVARNLVWCLCVW